MKQFFIRVGVAVVLALGGVLTGYLLGSGERGQLRRSLDAQSVEHRAAVAALDTQLVEAHRAIAVRDAIMSLNQAQREIGASNYGLAITHLDMGKAKLATAAQGGLESFASSMTTASAEIDAAKPLVNAQDDAAIEAIEQIIKSLEPKLK